MNKDNLVSLWWSSRDLKNIDSSKPIKQRCILWTLTLEKIQEDQKYDGYYVYETNRTDLSV